MVTLFYFGPIMFSINYEYFSFEGSNNFYDTHDTPQNRVFHYSMMFAVFIMMNLFNMINSRKLGLKQYNVFENFFNNMRFFIIMAGEIVATWAMIAFGGKIFRLEPIQTWGMFIAIISFAIGSLIISAASKALPEDLVNKIPELINETAAEGDDIFSKMQ